MYNYRSIQVYFIINAWENLSYSYEEILSYVANVSFKANKQRKMLWKLFFETFHRSQIENFYSSVCKTGSSLKLQE